MINNFCKKCTTFLLIIAVFLLPVDLLSQQRLPVLTKGMTQLEVIKHLGAPKEKVEYETKRQDEWIYDDTQAIFQNGTLASWSDKQGVDLLGEAVEQQDNTVKKQDKQTSASLAKNQDVFDDILSEIMRDSAGDDTPDVNSPGSVAVPGVFDPIPPIEPIN